MNKAKVYCFASAVAVCVASNPNMDVLAKQVQPVKLEEKAKQTITADDFIKQYLSTKEIVLKLKLLIEPKGLIHPSPFLKRHSYLQ